MGKPADQAEVLPAGQVLIDGGVLSGQADDGPYLLGPSHHIQPDTLACPASGSRMVVRIRTAVVLPAPLGPSRPSTLPASPASRNPSGRGSAARPSAGLARSSSGSGRWRGTGSGTPL